ncbi:hypothetical protein BC828DRAFT_406044 [Blastocladiella britannica]|nr:hypothetical protein BC828DRAFT_406044 [Blastocladiella britannica]
MPAPAATTAGLAAAAPGSAGKSAAAAIAKQSQQQQAGSARIDYYATLQVPRSADRQDIQAAYRRVALAHHPDRKPPPGAASSTPAHDPAAFLRAAEAYEVLSGAETRAVYDLFGFEGLEHGFPEAAGKPGYSGYKYHGDPMRTFRDFFGGDNVFYEVFKEHLYDPSTGARRVGFGSLRPETVHSAPIIVPLLMTMAELYTGMTKKVPWTRTVLPGASGGRPESRPETLALHVPAGARNGTRLVFPQRGDMAPNTVPADVVFEIKEVPHAHFTRDPEGNLVVEKTLSLDEALTGSVVEVTALDGRVVRVPVYEVVHPFYVKRVKGEGMPVPKSAEDAAAEMGVHSAQHAHAPPPSARADLLIKFRVEFPQYLTPKQKKQVHEALAAPPTSTTGA